MRRAPRASSGSAPIRSPCRASASRSSSWTRRNPPTRRSPTSRSCCPSPSKIPIGRSRAAIPATPCSIWRWAPRPRSPGPATSGHGQRFRSLAAVRAGGRGQGRVFVMDAESRVSALDANSGARLWRVNLGSDVASGKLLGGGVSYRCRQDLRRHLLRPGGGHGRRRRARCSGTRMSTGRCAPRLPTSSGRIFAVTIDNTLHVLAEDDGRELWTHSGLEEPAGMLGTATPAVQGSTGGRGLQLRRDLRAQGGYRAHAVERHAGRPASRRLDAMTIADIRGRPVIDRDLVVAISHSGIMAAMDCANAATGFGTPTSAASTRPGSPATTSSC